MRIGQFRGPQSTLDFLDRRRPASLRHAPRRRSCAGAGSAAVGFRIGACGAALALRPLREIAVDNFFPKIEIRAMVNRQRVRQPIAGRLVPRPRPRRVLEKTRFRVD